MPFAEPLYGAGRIYLAGRYGVMVDALKSLRSKIFPRSGFGVDWSAVQTWYLLADNGHVHWAGDVYLMKGTNMERKRKVNANDPPTRCKYQKCNSTLDLVHLEDYKWCVKCPKCGRYWGRDLENVPVSTPFNPGLFEGRLW